MSRGFRTVLAFLATGTMVGVLSGLTAATWAGTHASRSATSPAASSKIHIPTAADCPEGHIAGVHPGDPVACTHPDDPPPGVNVHAPVATAVLAARAGASLGAVAAADAVGVPSASALSVGSNLVCDGDGVSGNRVQAMYVVESGQPNRYAAMLASFKLWAAGVDDVFNRSAALNGGVRHLRFVTEGTAPQCTAEVQNVTVPAGSLANLTTELAAVQALGYTDQHRKYLMWTDANVYCGIGTLYVDPRPTQDNFNNGYAASFSRVDTGCWGFGASSAEGHSVEAHELTHNLGAVQPGAPHATVYGHCTDGSEVMCYPDNPDGVTPVTQKVCPTYLDALLDCNGDDYYSTMPAVGSYLSSNWNNASSQFLIGGGDGGSSSGSVGTLRAAVTVNGPTIPGLPTPVSVAVTEPAGDPHSTTWATDGTGCVVTADPSVADQGLLSCTAAIATQVSATVTDTTTGASTIASAEALFTGARGFTGQAPTRVLDTRHGIGAAQAKLGAGRTLTLTVPGLRAGTTAVALNVTVTGPTAGSYLSVYPGGGTRPTASNLNFTAGQTIPNLVVVQLGPGDTVTFYNSVGTVNVIADLVGSFAPGTGAGFTGKAPTRVLDTRYGIGAAKAKLGAGATLTLTVPGLPAGTTAVAINVTVTGPTAGSYLSVYPGGGTRPTASNLNFTAGKTIPNLVLVPLGPANKVTFYNAVGTVNVIADLVGYYAPGTGAGFTGQTPTRVLDTRHGIGAPQAKLGAGRTLTLTVPRLPAGTTAVAINVTVTNPTAGSYLSVYPGGGSRPTASNLNFTAGQTIPNLVLVRLGPGDTVTFYNSVGTVNVIADLVGYHS
jgi:plastocyanin